MKFTETKLKGAFVVEPEPLDDERGFFARTWCSREFALHGLDRQFVQCNVTFNHKSGTLRGMHYQIAPYEEAKLVRCTAGAIYDVILDIRHDSSTFTQWEAFQLSAENRRMIYIPEGFAHGFLTLADNTEVFYQMSQFFEPEYARGVRFDDLVFGIRWPYTPRIVSARDRSFPDFVLESPRPASKGGTIINS